MSRSDTARCPKSAGRRATLWVGAALLAMTAATIPAHAAPGGAASDRYPPSAPGSVEFVVTPAKARLAWESASDDTDIAGYVIRRAGVVIARLNRGATIYEDPTRGINRHTRYTVTALDIAGKESAPATAEYVGSTIGRSAPPRRATAGRTLSAVSTHLTRYPYLTDVVNADDNSVGYATVNWATDRSATTGSVSWGSVVNGTCTASTSQTASKTAITVNTSAQYQWSATLTLQPDTAYCYRVFLGSEDLLGADASPRFTSQVRSDSSTPFSFAVFGDWGEVDETGHNVGQANLMSQIASSGVRFAVTTGDNSYSSGSQANYGDLQQVGPGLSAIFGPSFWAVPGRSVPLFAAMGNHGFSRSDSVHPHLVNWPAAWAVSQSGGKYQRETYCCTTATSSANYPSTWYAFNAGRARVYVLLATWADGNTGTASGPYEVDRDNHWVPSSAEYQWLQADLAAHPGALKIAVFHYPLRSDQKHENSDTFLQGPSSLEGLLTSHGVKLAFNGHAHIYQRNTATADGLVSYVTGGGGAAPQSIGSAGCDALDAYGIGWSLTSNQGRACGAAPVPSSISQVYHFLKVTVDATSVTVTPTDSDGNTFDVVTYPMP